MANLNHTSGAPKPGRSMESRTNVAKRHAKQGDLFDPDELRRRLEAHLVEQKLQAERKRAKAAEQKSGAYHHIPKVAAADFARTATPETMGQRERHVHKLGEIALKYHADRVKIESRAPGASPLDLRYIQATDQARMQRDLEGDRNQFQRTKDLKDAAEYDRERNLYKVPQRTFGSDLFRAPRKDTRSRPLSTGDIPWEDDTDAQTYGKTKPRPFPIFTTNDRQDWAQRDEAGVGAHRSVKERVSPFLRRPESASMLKIRKEKSHPVSMSESDHIIPGVDVKCKRGNFLRRLMR